MSWEPCDQIARLQLHVTTTADPQIERHCARCKAKRPFSSSGKFRVNANGKMVDAWLIYRCDSCAQSWNYPVLERRLISTIDKALFAALMQNDPILAARHARAAEGKHGGASASAPGTDILVRRTFVRPVTFQTAIVVMSIEVGPACHVRLDRLMAQALPVSRAALPALVENGILEILPFSPNGMKRPAVTGQLLRLHLTLLPPALLTGCLQRV